MNCRVFLGGIASHTRQKDVEWFFRKYGRIREISIKNGFAFVDFESRRDASDAIYEMNGRELLGERVCVERARGGGIRPNEPRSSGRYGPTPRVSSRSLRYGPPQRTRFRVVVENLSTRVSWQDLKDFMRKAGEVTYADAHKQRKNEGVVEFASNKAMNDAVDRLNYTELCGRKIKLICVNKSRRSRSKSRSRSRSRSRRSSSSSSRSRSPRSRSRSRSESSKDKKTKKEEN